MDRTLAELEELVRNRICGVCSDRKMDGTCGLEEPGQCALFRLFPQVAEAIQTTHSDNIEDYIGAIRRKVCTVCTAQDKRRQLRSAPGSAVRAGRLSAAGGGGHRRSHGQGFRAAVTQPAERQAYFSSTLRGGHYEHQLTAIRRILGRAGYRRGIPDHLPEVGFQPRRRFDPPGGRRARANRWPWPTGWR